MGGEALLYHAGESVVAKTLHLAINFETGASAVEGMVLESGRYDVLVDPWIGAEVVIESGTTDPLGHDQLPAG